MTRTALAALLLFAASANGQALQKPRIAALSERVYVLRAPRGKTGMLG